MARDWLEKKFGECDELEGIRMIALDMF